MSKFLIIFPILVYLHHLPKVLTHIHTAGGF